MSAEPVLIGVPSGTLTRDTSAFANVIGGDPLLPAGLSVPRCRLCNDDMFFLFRIDAPVGDVPFTRLLYAFLCARPCCFRSDPQHCFRFLRINVTREDGAAASHAAPAAVIDLDSWHIDGADDWGEEEEVCEASATSGNGWAASLEPCPVLPAAASSSAPSSTSSSPFSFVHRGTTAFAGAFLDVYEEPLDGAAKSSALTEHERALLSAYYDTADVDAAVKDLYRAAAAGEVDAEEGEAGEDCGCEGSALDDKLFSKFVRRLAACPEQVLRYAWAGAPLLAAALEPEDAGRAAVCAVCGGRAVFELQLTPGLFHQLRASAEEVRAVLCDASVATVLLFSCQRACWASDAPQWREEQCLVQLETQLAEPAEVDD